ncbi:CopG family ribbon-helix-helix protein [Isoalcanivorax indicus]|uniref:CopG family ribbon-helix-helix protein n=1 Tax=Isoalcanivorax indicus TaxID=2202653 RepID=UPI000DBA65C2|nr:ribbon-helix-helix protein, CopG family [Isoalcanivorax indicus]
MPETTTITIRLPLELKTQLDHLAGATNRSKSLLAAEAIRNFIELNEWRVRELQDAVQEAAAGDFAAPEEVSTVLAKWGE